MTCVGSDRYVTISRYQAITIFKTWIAPFETRGLRSKLTQLTFKTFNYIQAKLGRQTAGLPSDISSCEVSGRELKAVRYVHVQHSHLYHHRIKMVVL